MVKIYFSLQHCCGLDQNECNKIPKESGLGYFEMNYLRDSKLS